MFPDITNIDVVLVGDKNHAEIGKLAYLTQNMPEMKQKGAKHIFLEMPEHFQSAMDTLLSPSGTFEQYKKDMDEIREDLGQPSIKWSGAPMSPKDTEAKEEFENFITTAKSQGIKVHCADITPEVILTDPNAQVFLNAAVAYAKRSHEVGAAKAWEETSDILDRQYEAGTSDKFTSFNNTLVKQRMEANETIAGNITAILGDSKEKGVVLFGDAHINERSYIVLSLYYRSIL
jgi:hypothetical protein